MPLAAPVMMAALSFRRTADSFQKT